MENRNYELVVLLHPDLELDIDTPIGKLEQLVSEAGGKVIKRDNWGKKRLAYPIRQHQFAVYVLFILQLDPAKTDAINRGLQLSEEVIRYLLVKQPEASTKPKKTKSKVKSEEADEKVEEKEVVNG